MFSVAVVVIVRMGSVLFPILCFLRKNLKKKNKKKKPKKQMHPLHSGCADPWDFPKCGKLDCIICGSGGLRSRFPLEKKKKRKKKKKTDAEILIYLICGWAQTKV